MGEAWAQPNRDSHSPSPSPALQGPALQGSAYLVLPQEEGQQHQHPPIMDNPPDIDVAL